MTAKKVNKLFEETVEISGDSGPSEFGDKTLAEKRKALIGWIKELTGDDEAETAGKETTEEAKASPEAEAVSEDTSVDGTVEVDAENETVTVSDKAEPSDDKNSDKADAGSDNTETADEKPVEAKEKPAEKKKPAEKASEDKAADKKPAEKKAGKKPKAEPDENDPIYTMAAKIEQINDLATVEEQALELMQQDKVNEFQLGGYLLRLQSSEDYVKSQSEDWKSYVEDVIGIKSRKAFYLMNIYKSLTEAEVTWEQFQDIGWTKVVALFPVLETHTAGDPQVSRLFAECS